MASKTKFIKYNGKRYKVTGVSSSSKPMATAYFFHKKGKARGWHKVVNLNIRTVLAKRYKK